MNNALFICTGNFYRSRLAELLFNHHCREAELDWRAVSRGILCENVIRGLSDSAVRYLEKTQLTECLQKMRDPMQLKIQDLEEARLIVGLNRKEHEPMMRARMGNVPRALEENGKLIFWNVADVPIETGFLLRLMKPDVNKDRQPEESSAEHIHFAVRCLVGELREDRNAPYD